MRILIEQLERSLDSNLYYLSLFTALTLPDIAGALDSDDGVADRPKYVDWYEKWVRPRFADSIRQCLPPEVLALDPNLPESPITGDACYRFRCSLLHQGSTQHPKSPFDRVIFVEPGATDSVLHNNIMNRVLIIDLRLFCLEVIAGVRSWLNQVESTARFRDNYENFARRHPDGFPGLINGVPVVG
jgi:hypothetical protein